MTFKDDKDGTEKTVQAPLGKSLLEVRAALAVVGLAPTGWALLENKPL